MPGVSHIFTTFPNFFSPNEGRKRGFGNGIRWSIYRNLGASARPLVWCCPDSSVHKMNNLQKGTCKYLFIIHYNELRQE